MKKEQLIFSDSWSDADEDDLRNDIWETDFDDEYPTPDDVPDEKLWVKFDSQIQCWWEDVEYELRNFFNNSDDIYILYGSAGLWNGRRAGGFIFYNYDGLQKAWSVNYTHETRIYEDKNGVFSIDIYHHDGTNCWEVRKLTEKGRLYLELHKDMSDRELHEKLWENPYSVNLNFTKKVYG